MNEENLNISEDLTPEEQLELANYLRGGLASYGSTAGDDKHNIHKFLHDVVTAKDTTKLGNLEIKEIGLPKYPLRVLKELSLFCQDVANMDYFSTYFQKQSEIMTATSLSKDAKLLDLAVVTRRELGDITRKPKKKNTGWFKKKGEASEEE